MLLNSFDGLKKAAHLEFELVPYNEPRYVRVLALIPV
ncbi:MAG: hypothetical protein RIR96_904, partial [Bacteroidota bacterium]